MITGLAATLASCGRNGNAQQPAERLPAQEIVSIQLPASIDFAGEEVPLELYYVSEALERELLVNTYWHSSTLLLLKRANRWLPVIEPILKKNGIPDDFKYLAMIESNLTNSRSPAGAAGFWQFLEGTAREYQLEVTDQVDERYHLEKATEAACRYFRRAYNKYNSWALVAAAYNAGTRRIDDFLSRQQTDSYFDLLMAEETERYLYRILAIKMIHRNPRAFGFYPDLERLYEPLSFREIQVSESIPNLVEFARSQGVSYKLLRMFNPWLRTHELTVKPGKTYTLKIPDGRFARTHRPIRS
ncbi:MAG: lytic transglycosylase domain-containing protein [Bacteroidetes bacterium]|nr:lytic transglycosylase domain-containing protein [Bacteroidota bacterium]